MRTWTDRMATRIKGQEPAIPWFLHDKLRCYEWCEELNFELPKVYGVWKEADSIELPASDDPFVLKPTRFSSMRGVMVLRKDGEQYYDEMSRRAWAANEIIVHQKTLAEKYSVPANRWIVEERVTDRSKSGIPIDYKAYAFRGTVSLMLVIDRNTTPTSVTWYDSSFRPVSEDVLKLNPKYVQRGDLNPPANAEEIMKVAESVSRRVGTPFARIDIYNSHRGPLIGEITLTPGGLYYGDHYKLSTAQDRLMGEMWSTADAHLDMLRDALAELVSDRPYAWLDVQQKKLVDQALWRPQKVREAVAAN